MAEIKKYRIVQKTGEESTDYRVLHPETDADIVKTTQINDAKGQKLIDAGNAQTVLETLARNIQAATTGAVNDVKVKDGDVEESVVTSGIATIDLSDKVDKVEGKGLSTNDYDADAVAEVAKIAGKQDTLSATNKLDTAFINTTDDAQFVTKAEKTAWDAAEANVINAITVNGTAVTVTDKTAAITIPAAAEYSLVKDTNSGVYAAVYHLTKDGNNVGAAINIPKDLVVKSGAVVDHKIEGVTIKCIELTLNDESEDKIYIPVSDLVDAYTGDNTTIEISNTNVVSVKSGVFADATEFSGIKTTVGDATSGLVKDVADLKNVGATKVEATAKSGKISINGTEVQIVADNTVVDANYVHTDNNLTDDLVTKIGNATAVSATAKSGKITIDGTEVQVVADNTVTDADYKHITVSATSVSDGTTTFNKYDDTALANRVTTVEGYFANAKEKSIFSVVQTNEHGVVINGGKLVEVGVAADADLVVGGILFQEITE